MRSALLALVIASVAVLSFGDELSNCKCQPEFEAKKDEGDGVVKCFGTILKIIKPCNEVLLPQCRCRPEATSVVMDKDGAHCGKYEHGKEITRWPCENQAEFDHFYAEHPDRRPTL